MLQFSLSFNKALLTERTTERHMNVENRGRLIRKMETTGYIKLHRSSSEIRSVTLDTS
jgi:hypothetical protein